MTREQIEATVELRLIKMRNYINQNHITRALITYGEAIAYMDMLLNMGVEYDEYIINKNCDENIKLINEIIHRGAIT